jgi:hypothetical protein
MIYYLTNEQVNARRVTTEYTTVDDIVVRLIQSGIKTRIITKSELLKLVDSGVMPANNDIIYIKYLDSDVLNYLKPLRNREFKIINDIETLKLLNNFLLTADTLFQAGVSVRLPIDSQIFSKFNYDRNRGFGQGFEDFIVEFIKEKNLKTFNLISTTKTARYGYFDNAKVSGGYQISDVSLFDWTTVDLSTSYYILEGSPSRTVRIPVVNKLPLFDGALSTDKHFIDNLKLEKNTDVLNIAGIEQETYKVINALNLEVGFIDFQLLNDQLTVFNVSNMDQDYCNPYDLDSHIVNFLVSQHGN